MIRKFTFPTLLAVAAVTAATPAFAASLNLDLRFGLTGNPAGAAISADGKTATIDPAHAVGAAGTYSVQLWAQITDPTHAWSTDAYTVFNTNLQSSQTTSVNGGALTAGGVTNVQISSAASASTAGAQSSITGDGISDWGAATTTTSSGWINWQNANGSSIVGFIAGTPTAGLSEQVAGNPDAWEVLLGTFTIDASALHAQDANDHQTAFLVGSMDKFRTGPTTTAGANSFFLDGTSLNSKANLSSFSIGGTPFAVGLNAASGIVFDVPVGAIPEPASLGVLALGGMALFARRRRK